MIVVHTRTNLQFKYSLVEWLSCRLGVRVFNHELQRTHNCVEETVHDNLIDVIDIGLPNVTFRIGIQQFTVLLVKQQKAKAF